MNQMFEAMSSNYKAWCSGFAPMVVGGDMDSVHVQEFCRTLFNMRPDISLSLAHVKFSSDIRHLLTMVKVPCHILQGKMDKVVPVEVSEYLHQTLGGPSIVELMPTNGHLPQLSSPEVVVAVIVKHLRLDITQ
ncbi:hypothetical protein JCGZ_12498 [Jatropha curcas]|uniref:AB hydrolase-1 domain-containing protein n=2 Tax=Jatropha curcas TaxID=180498 RepID=A0A067K7D8_JATCU|nr:hypothetical protein JCGZ_12498 [Jatropha curcas]